MGDSSLKYINSVITLTPQPNIYMGATQFRDIICIAIDNICMSIINRLDLLSPNRVLG